MKIIKAKSNQPPLTPKNREEIEELERYIKELTTFLPLPFCVVSPKGVILNINRAFSDLTGYSDLDIVGEEIARLFLNKKEAKILEEKIFRDGTAKNQEIILLTKNKNQLTVNVSGSLRKDNEGNIVGYFLAFSDISELKKFQRQLEQMVEGRTKELKEKVDELEKFNRLTIGRELKMIELKQEIETLKEKLKRFETSQKRNRE